MCIHVYQYNRYLETIRDIGTEIQLEKVGWYLRVARKPEADISNM